MEPWIEKYRPKQLNDILLSDTNRKIAENMIETNEFHNTIFYGPPGTGKTSTIMCMMKKYSEKYKCKKNYLHLNASHDRGINVVKNDIYNFVMTTSFFKNKYKFVILDEVDSMTCLAQVNLHELMMFRNDTHFFLICNYIHKIIEPIRTKLLLIDFYDSSKYAQTYIQEILNKEKKNIPDKVILRLQKQYKHDIRSIINSIQSYSYDDNVSKTAIEIKDLVNKYTKNKLLKALKIYDIKTLLCLIFEYLHSNFSISSRVINEMKNIFLNYSNEYTTLNLHDFMNEKKYLKN